MDNLLNHVQELRKNRDELNHELDRIQHEIENMPPETKGMDKYKEWIANLEGNYQPRHNKF